MKAYLMIVELIVDAETEQEARTIARAKLPDEAFIAYVGEHGT